MEVFACSGCGALVSTSSKRLLALRICHAHWRESLYSDLTCLECGVAFVALRSQTRGDRQRITCSIPCHMAMMNRRLAEKRAAS